MNLNFITKDISEKNEKKTVMVTLRMLYLLVFSAFVLDTLLAGAETIRTYPWQIVILFVAVICLFASTYRVPTRVSLILFVIYLFVWTLSMIPVYGWSAGMQNYYIIILMLTFFASYRPVKIKFMLAGLVLLFRILTIGYFGGIRSVIVTDPNIDKLIQTANISAVFISIIIISYMFSRKDNEADNKLMKYNDQLMMEANTDKLTGLFNRRKADDILRSLKDEGGLENVSLAIGDIDLFKKVNDGYGHDAGDAVIREVGRRMKATCREDAFLARWGGEEFLLIFPGCNGDEAYVELERLRASIKAEPVEAGGHNISITMTFGLAELPYDRDTDVAVKEADEKMYHGKQNGRDQVVY